MNSQFKVWAANHPGIISILSGFAMGMVMTLFVFFAPYQVSNALTMLVCLPLKLLLSQIFSTALVWGEISKIWKVDTLSWFFTWGIFFAIMIYSKLRRRYHRAYNSEHAEPKRTSSRIFLFITTIIFLLGIGSVFTAAILSIVHSSVSDWVTTICWAVFDCISVVLVLICFWIFQSGGMGNIV